MTRRPAPVDGRLAALVANRALLTVSAVALAAGAVTRACPPTAAHRPLAQRTPPPQEDVDRVLREAGATGLSVAVWTWNAGYLEGDPGAEPLLRALRWVAPVGSPHAPRGTVTAWSPPAGGVRLAGTDDDAELAAALGRLGPADALVRDGRAWLVVSGDEVRWLVGSPSGEPAPAATGSASELGPAVDAAPTIEALPVVTVAAYRDTLAGRVPEPEPAPGAGWRRPDGGPAGG